MAPQPDSMKAPSPPMADSTSTAATVRVTYLASVAAMCCGCASVPFFFCTSSAVSAARRRSAAGRVGSHARARSCCSWYVVYALQKVMEMSAQRKRRYLVRGTSHALTL